MPEQPGGMAKDIAKDVHGILVAIGSRKLQDNKVHRLSTFPVRFFVSRLDFKPVILDDRVAQNPMAGIVDLFAGGFPVRAVQFDFEILADMHRPDSVVAHLRQGVPDGFTLGIEHCLFWCDDNLRFHFKRAAASAMLGQEIAGGEKFLGLKVFLVFR
jgi:hypothetical protein